MGVPQVEGGQLGAQGEVPMWQRVAKEPAIHCWAKAYDWTPVFGRGRQDLVLEGCRCRRQKVRGVGGENEVQ